MREYYEARMSAAGISICMIICGLPLAFYPELSGVIFTRGFAAFVLVLALINLWRWRRARKYDMGGRSNLAGAVVLAVLSGIGFFKPEILLGFLPFLTGAFLILDGLIKFPLVMEQRGCGGMVRGTGILSVLLPLVLGIILAAYPFHAAAAVIRFFGIFLIVDGAADIVRTAVLLRKG